MKKLVSIATAAVLLCAFSAGSVFAFTDLDPAEQGPITQLKERGIVAGVDSDHFAPRGQISFAQSISLIVKGLNLNIDNMRFIKKPEASDYFTNIPNDAWYADAFIIAKLKGLDIPQNVDPNATITREQYADLLIHAMEKKGSFPMVKMFIVFVDADQMSPAYQGSMQRLYLYKIAALGEDRMAYPQREMTRGEAAVWLYNTIQFVESHTGKPNPVQQEEVKIIVEPVSDTVNKVTLTRGEMPNPGYGIAINGIQFQDDQTAVISYTLTDPKPDGMYAQVITEAKAVTYVPAQYKPVAENAAGSGQAGTADAPSEPAAPVADPAAQ